MKGPITEPSPMMQQREPDETATRPTGEAAADIVKPATSVESVEADGSGETEDKGESKESGDSGATSNTGTA